MVKLISMKKIILTVIAVYLAIGVGLYFYWDVASLLAVNNAKSIILFILTWPIAVLFPAH